MSEHETPYLGIGDQTGQEPYSGIEDMGQEEDKRVMEENSSAEERQTPLEEKIPENRGEEKEKLKRTKKKVPKSRQEYSANNIGKQLEKQTAYLAKLEQVLQPLQKLSKRSDEQLRLIKNINVSVKQMERQIIQIQKTIKKGKTRKK
jgi:small-conductance mechanosensitive channel